MRRAKQRNEEPAERNRRKASFKSKMMFNIGKMARPKVGLFVGVCLCIASTAVIYILSSHFKEPSTPNDLMTNDQYHAEKERSNEVIDDEVTKAEYQPVIKHGRFKDKVFTNETLQEEEDDNLMHDSERPIIIEDDKKEGNLASIDENYVLLQLVNAHGDSKFASNFHSCIKSILKRTKLELKFLLTVDKISKETAEKCFKNVANELKIKRIPQRTYFLIEEVNKKVYPYTKALQELFSSGQGAYYSHAIFFIGPVLHKILPSTINHLVMLDTDLQFRTDIKQLIDIFPQMSPNQIMAIATDQQPVYRHVLWSYRQKNPGTKIGDPPPHGRTGFNSGVKLINLEEMRNSQVYNELLHGQNASRLASKYEFKGHLGDQDFYSLLSFDYPDLFYTLPCQWNRQLCTWWKDHGYKDVFDQYFNCSPPFHVIHGNCNTPIPDE